MKRCLLYSIAVRTQLQRLVLGAHHPVEPDQDGASLNVLAHLQHSDEVCDRPDSRTLIDA